jgi:succinoglycan biosynthesis transport protein ExoP
VEGESLEHNSRHEASSLSTYLRVLRRRKWIVLVCAILVPVTAYVFAAREPAQYQASALVYLSSQDIAGALTGFSAPYVDETRLADTQAMLAHVPVVAERAIKLSGVSGMTPAGLLGSASIVPVGDTSILAFTVTSSDPVKAERLATAYARAFTTHRGELDSQAVRTARAELNSKLAQLTADGGKKSKLAVDLRSKDQQLATVEALQTSRTYVIRTADSAVQIAPKPKKNAILGLMLGIVLGLGLAFAVEALDTRVRSAAEVGGRLGLPQLARVPPPPRGLAKDDRLVMLAQPTGTNAEAFRMLRTNLDFATLENHGSRTILVTSAVEREGKSTTAANLAIAEARSGRRVALVDLDLRVPYLDRFFGLLHAEGITDVALGRIPLESALKRIDLETGSVVSSPRSGHEGNGRIVEHGCLDVLVSGARPPDPGEFVGSRPLAEILALLHKDYDLVIIDTPPVLRVGDAMTLSSRADGILVVTKLNAIRRTMLAELRRTLETAPARKLGFVVTGSGDQQTGGQAYGYWDGHGGYGGYGFGEPKPVEKPRSGADHANGTRTGVAAPEGSERA